MKIPSIEEALSFAALISWTTGGIDGEWTSEDCDEPHHAKLTNHGIRCLIVLADYCRYLEKASRDAHTTLIDTTLVDP